MLNILFLELQAFPATPVGDFIGLFFLFRCKYIKNVKAKVRLQGIFCAKICANDYTGIYVKRFACKEVSTSRQVTEMSQ